MNPLNSLDTAEQAVLAGTVHGGVHFHTPAVSVPAPHELPPAPGWWVNRNDSLQALTYAADSQPGPVVMNISGARGHGKTALAVHWATRERARWPEGQLYADLAQDEISEVLAGWLAALGMRRIPHSLARLTAAWRSAGAERAVLVLIDHAVDARQVTALLPGSPASVTLVTSHVPLPQLAGWGSLHPLPPLGQDAAAELVCTVTAAHGIALAPEEARGLARSAGGSPMRALLIAAATALTSSAPSRRAQQPEVDIRSVRGLARELPAPQQQLIKGLGALPLPCFGLEVVQAILVCDASTAQEHLGALEHCGLVRARDGRYFVPDLLHAEMQEWAREDPDARQALVTLLLERVFLPKLLECDRRLNPHPHRFNDPDFRIPEVGAFAAAGDARDWYAAERATLRHLIEQAVAEGHDTVVCRMAEAMWGGGLETRAHSTLQPVLRAAIKAAERTGNPALVLFYARLALSLRASGDAEAALAAAETGRQLAAATGDDRSEYLALSAQGRALLALGRPGAAVAALEHARDKAHGLGERRSVALHLQHLAEAQGMLGSAERAAEHLQQAGHILRQLGDQKGLARASTRLADLLIRTRPADALQELQDTICRLGAEGGVYLADAHLRAGRAATELDDPARAREHFVRAGELYAQAGAWDDHATAKRELEEAA